jgi:hypothetical protein
MEFMVEIPLRFTTLRRVELALLSGRCVAPRRSVNRGIEERGRVGDGAPSAVDPDMPGDLTPHTEGKAPGRSRDRLSSTWTP